MRSISMHARCTAMSSGYLRQSSRSCRVVGDGKSGSCLRGMARAEHCMDVQIAILKCIKNRCQINCFKLNVLT